MKGGFMSRLDNDELLNITGGGFSTGLIFGIIGVGVLIAGIVDGILRPSACNK